MNKKVVIITGGELDIEWAKKWLLAVKADYIIAADSGVEYAMKIGCRVDYLLGDYDSADKNIITQCRNNNIDMVAYPKEKDYTDTELAVRKAIECGGNPIYILGATGTRLDHTMANIYNMKMALDNNRKCYIVNPNNRIQLIKDTAIISKDKQYGKYVSILPYTDKVTKITMTGFYYPLKNYDLCKGVSVGISNEIVEDTAKIELEDGIIILYETLD